MRWRTILILWLIAAALLGYYLLAQPEPSRLRQRVNIFGEFVAAHGPLAQSAIKLTIANESGRAVIRRDDNQAWRLIEPIQDRADDEETAELLRALEALTSIRTTPIAPHEPQWESYGIVANSPFVQIETADGARAIVRIGERSGVGGAVCAALEGRDEVYFISPVDIASLLLDANDLRDKRALRFAPETVEGLAFAAANAEMRLSRDDSDWRITAPFQDIADNAAVNSLLTRLSRLALTRDDFIADEKRTLEDFGLAPPQLRLEVLVGGETLALNIGDFANADKTKIYASRGNDRQVLTLASKDVVGVIKSPRDLRQQRVLVFDPADVREIAVTTPAGEAALQKTETGWMITRPVSRPAEAARVQALLNALAQLNASDWIDGASDLAAYGLGRGPGPGPGKPLAGVTLTLTNGAAIGVIVGKLGDNGKLAHVQRSAGGPVIIVPADFLRHMTKGYLSFLPAKVAGVKRDAAQRIAVERPENSFALRRGNDGGWIIETPEPRAADAKKVSELLTQLETLKAENYIVGGADLAAYGLDKNCVRLTIEYRGTDGADAAMILLIGKPSDADTRFAKLEEGDAVFLLRDALPRLLEQDFAAAQ